MVIHIKLYDLFESYNGLVIDCRISKSTFLYIVCFLMEFVKSCERLDYYYKWRENENVVLST